MVYYVIQKTMWNQRRGNLAFGLPLLLLLLLFQIFQIGRRQEYMNEG